MAACSCGIPKRYILLSMVFLGFMTMYALRVNLNVAIGAMVNNHTVIENGRAVQKTAEFDWNSKLQGIILGSLYYGYAVLQIPGGWMSLKLGGTRIFGYGIFLASLLTILTAPAARYSVKALIAVRVGEGLFLGVLAACNLTIWSKWAHPMERTIVVSVAMTGCAVGTIITLPLSGLLTNYGFDGGSWPSVFYCFGAFGVLWFLVWNIVAYDCPSLHPSISQEEKKYLSDGIGTVQKCTFVPWGSILTSKHVWAIAAANISGDWALYTILICLPTFLLDIMHFDIQAAGFVAALPFVVSVVTAPSTGIVSDILRRNGVRTKTVRSICFGVGSVMSAFFLVLAGYCTSSLAVIVNMCLSVGFGGVAGVGYQVNTLDIAPKYAGILTGFSNTLGTMTGFLSPMLVGVLTSNKKASEWQTVFWITAGVNCVGAAIFCLFVDDQPQPWAVDENILDKEEVAMEEADTTGVENTDEKDRTDKRNDFTI